MARILVVDDVRFISQMIAGVFERVGHRVETAADGEEALRKALAMLPDLIVMDVAMPNLDGLEVTRRLRASDRCRDIPVLLVTSRADAGTLTAAAQAGVDDHLAKPFEAAALLAKSARLLGGYPMTFDLELFGECAVVTALPEELADAVRDQVRIALEHARSAALGTILLDLTRVARADAQVAEGILAFEEAYARDGGSLALVRPKSGPGVRGFLGVVTPRLTIHEDLATARKALGVAPEGSGQPIPPPRRQVPRTTAAGPVPAAPAAPRPPSAPAPPDASAPHAAPQAAPHAAPHAVPHGAVPVTRTGAARGVVVESHPRATIFRIHRHELDDEVTALLVEEVARSPRPILLEMATVPALDAARAKALGDVAERAAAAGGSLRIVNPATGVEQALAAAGLGFLVLRTRAADGAPTRSSS
jgi:CheY-like chemotaxis protein